MCKQKSNNNGMRVQNYIIHHDIHQDIKDYKKCTVHKKRIKVLPHLEHLNSISLYTLGHQINNKPLMKIATLNHSRITKTFVIISSQCIIMRTNIFLKHLKSSIYFLHARLWCSLFVTKVIFFLYHVSLLLTT